VAYTWNNDVVQSNLVKANELLEIRDKINLERTRRGIGTTTFSQPLVVGNVINYAAVDEIRNRVIGIKACSLPEVGSLMTSSLINSFKNQLDVFNNTPGTPVYGWVDSAPINVRIPDSNLELPTAGVTYYDWRVTRTEGTGSFDYKRYWDLMVSWGAQHNNTNDIWQVTSGYSYNPTTIELNNNTTPWYATVTEISVNANLKYIRGTLVSSHDATFKNPSWHWHYNVIQSNLLLTHYIW